MKQVSVSNQASHQYHIHRLTASQRKALQKDAQATVRAPGTSAYGLQREDIQPVLTLLSPMHGIYYDKSGANLVGVFVPHVTKGTQVPYLILRSKRTFTSEEVEDALTRMKSQPAASEIRKQLSNAP